jgi:hypothetical protein
MLKFDNCRVIPKVFSPTHCTQDALNFLWHFSPQVPVQKHCDYVTKRKSKSTKDQFFVFKPEIKSLSTLPSFSTTVQPSTSPHALQKVCSISIDQ